MSADVNSNGAIETTNPALNASKPNSLKLCAHECFHPLTFKLKQTLKHEPSFVKWSDASPLLVLNIQSHIGGFGYVIGTVPWSYGESKNPSLEGPQIEDSSSMPAHIAHNQIGIKPTIYLNKSNGVT